MSKSVPVNVGSPVRAAGSASSAREELRDQAFVVGEDVKEFGHLTKDVTKGLVEDGKRKATEYYEKGRDRARDLEARLEDYVREHPWKSVLYAGGAGLLLSVLLRRS